MNNRRRYLADPETCGYLPQQQARFEYEFARTMGVEEYSERLLQGWRRFGISLFRPRCLGCQACQSLRVVVNRFRPDRSQRRVRKANEGVVALRIGDPSLSPEKLDLYHRYHEFQHATKGWAAHDDASPASYAGSFLVNPLPTQEWSYFLQDRLVGVGYVDDLPIGLSAIYFFYDPEHRDRGLGTWNILCQIDRCRALARPHLYLGYHVEACRSLAYKARFVPNQILASDGDWADFRS